MLRPLLPLSLLMLVQAPTPSSPPDTEIFLATLTTTNGAVAIARPVNITNSPGYDNQPSFTPDGRSVLFTSIRGGTQTDIYRYDIASRAVSRVTDTPESEYSPTVTPDRRHISVIRVEADGTQRLWQFTSDGRDPEVILRDVKPVGYHAWTDPQTLVLFVLGQPSTLQLADTRSGRAEILARDVGRSIQPIPLRGTVSFVAREAGGDGPPRLHVNELDPQTRAITTLIDAPAGARDADVAWAPDGLLLIAKDDVLYGWQRSGVRNEGQRSEGRGQRSEGRGQRAGDLAEWKRVADLAALGLTGVTRLAVSPSGDRIAFVTQRQSAPAAK